MDRPVTLGRKIAERRRAKNLSQKQLAEQIRRHDGSSISPQYLNDIERDRRVPPDYLIECFAAILDVDPDYLIFLAGRIPPSMSHLADEHSFQVFRRAQ